MGFSCEYAVRLSVCTEGGVSRRKWIIEPSNVCDFLAIVPFYVELLKEIPDPRPTDPSNDKPRNGMGGVSSGQVFKTLRLVRLFRLFRISSSDGTAQGCSSCFRRSENL